MLRKTRLLVWFVGGIAAIADEPPPMRAGTNSLRRMATSIVEPRPSEEWPADCQPGPVVAELRLSKLGRIENVTILESPCTSVGSSVANALQQWKFTTDRLPGRLVGKIVYYYLLKDGKPLLIISEQAPIISLGNKPQRERKPDRANGSQAVQKK